MNMMSLSSYTVGKWRFPKAYDQKIYSAINGQPIAEHGDFTLIWTDVLSHARNIGARHFEQLTFHDRARILKKLALYLSEHKQQLYDISFHTGATYKDSAIDIDGGIATLFVYASKGRKEMPDDTVYLDGNLEMLSREGTFVGQHICLPKQGIALHINAFNFPVWGMLEKFAQSFLAGVPSIVKPATVTGYLSYACVKLMVASGILPEGSLQLVFGRTSALFTLLSAQDSVSFTGSAETAHIIQQSLGSDVNFCAEQDSLNAAILGPDATTDSPEFSLFIKEAVHEITTKAGQKCTAMRRLIVPDHMLSDVKEALIAKLSTVTIGDPRKKETRMGALVSLSHRQEVIRQAEKIAADNSCLWDGESLTKEVLSEFERGSFLAPRLYYSPEPNPLNIAHHTEAFGPVVTLMGYNTTDQACTLANLGGGSLVISAFSQDSHFIREAAIKVAPWHGRIYLNQANCAKEATGHGSPLPHMVHGGPGRAGGGEELGGIRGVLHYMQRTAVQGSPDQIAAICQEWIPGAKSSPAPCHPFRLHFEELDIGMGYRTPERTITREDIDHFSTFTGDTFYAHTDPIAAEQNPFFPGVVAHGYLLLSFAAGLFVDPAPGPVLANTGLFNLAFVKPVEPGEKIYASLTVKRKTPRNEDYGEVRWYVEIYNQNNELAAHYQLLTMNAFKKS